MRHFSLRDLFVGAAVILGFAVLVTTGHDIELLAVGLVLVAIALVAR